MNRFISIPVGDCGQNNNAADDDEVIKVDAETEAYFNSFPPGYCFCPTDSELILDYLKRKLNNVPLPRNKMHEVNIYKYNPEKLSKKFPLTSKNEWYFFTPRDRKYCNGTRPNRAAGTGYWKATVADTQIPFQNQLVGFKKSLVFYEGKPPNGEKTNWLMNEFRVNAEPRKKTSTNDMKLDDYVLCRIYKNQIYKNHSEKNNKNKRKLRDDDESQTINYPSFDYSQDQQMHICYSFPQNYATPTTTIAAPVNSMPMNSVDAAAAAVVVVPDCPACASSMPVNSETATDDAAANDSEKNNRNKRSKNEWRDNDESQTVNYPSFDYSQGQQIHICYSFPQNYATPTTTIAAPVHSMPMNSVDDAAAAVFVPDCTACASIMPVTSETATDDAAASDFELDLQLLMSSPPKMQL